MVHEDARDSLPWSPCVLIHYIRDHVCRWMDGCMDGWMRRRRDGWMHGQMDIFSSMPIRDELC